MTRLKYIFVLLLPFMFATGCASLEDIKKKRGAFYFPSYRSGKVGSNPYSIDGTKYYPLDKAAGFQESGLASWYGPGFDGKRTASGEIYAMDQMTAAHKTLPIGSKVEVLNRDNGKKVTVRINDRGPFVKGRIIDLSRAAASKLDIIKTGTSYVTIKVAE